MKWSDIWTKYSIWTCWPRVVNLILSSLSHGGTFFNSWRLNDDHFQYFTFSFVFLSFVMGHQTLKDIGLLLIALFALYSCEICYLNFAIYFIKPQHEISILRRNTMSILRQFLINRTNKQCHLIHLWFYMVQTIQKTYATFCNTNQRKGKND